MRNIIRKIPLLNQIVTRIRSKPRDDKYAKCVSNSAHNSIELLYQGVAVPPIRFRDMVRKGAVLAEDFLLEGRQVYEAINQLLSQNNVKVTKLTKIHEFGVGCGRVARYFHQDGFTEFSGSDVDPELIEWCRMHLQCSNQKEGNRFFTNDYLPPLSCEPDRFDVVYVISVYTHMDVDAQKAWFSEMHRVIRPGGTLLISFLERDEAELPEGIKVVKRIDKEFKRSWLGNKGAPEIYYNTYNTLKYLRESLSPSFLLVDHSPNVVRGVQSLALFKKN